MEQPAPKNDPQRGVDIILMTAYPKTKPLDKKGSAHASVEPSIK